MSVYAPIAQTVDLQRVVLRAIKEATVAFEYGDPPAGSEVSTSLSDIDDEKIEVDESPQQRRYMAVFMARKRRRLRLALEIENGFRKRRAVPVLQGESKQLFERQCAAHWKLLLDRALSEAKCEHDDYLSKDQIAEIRETFWLDLENDLMELAEIERRDKRTAAKPLTTKNDSPSPAAPASAISRGASFPYAYEFNRASGTLTDLKTGIALSGGSITRDEGKVPGWIINHGGRQGWAADIYTRFV